MNLGLLPEDCFSYILSFTSPRDACCVSLVSSVIRTSADSDTVWEKFLPPDYQDALCRISSPLVYASKKDLFCRLCSPHLIDGGRKLMKLLMDGQAMDQIWILELIFDPLSVNAQVTLSCCHLITWLLFQMFWLERSTSKKSYIVSARDLSITWASNPLYWSWNSRPDSRFANVAELRTIWWLQIEGQFNTGMLSPKTSYGAYLIVQFADRAYGLDTLQSEVSLEVGNFKSQGKVCLRRENKSKYALKWRVPEGTGSTKFAREREDGWAHIELGSFYNDGVDREVRMCLKETGEHLKGGLIVEGIELRPEEREN